MLRSFSRSLMIPTLALGLFLSASPAQAATINLTASMDCLQAGQPSATGTCGAGGTGTGTASITLDDVTNLLSWNMSWSGLSGNTTVAHFHLGAPGASGGVVLGFSPTTGATSGTAVGSATISAAQETDLLAGLWYINIHSSTFGGGEIRGQVLVPEPSVLALLGAGLLFLRRRS